MKAMKKKGVKPVKVGKKKPAQKSANSSSKGAHTGNAMIAHQICSVTNPFCPEALSGKWPDGSFVKSNVWSVDGAEATITSNATGDGALLFYPGFNYNFVGYASAVGDTVTFNAAASILAAVPTNVNRFRITSWGLRISTATPAMTTQGMLQIRLFSPITYTSMGIVVKSTRFADTCEDIPLTRLLDKDHFIIPMPMGEDARKWQKTEGATSTWTNFDNIGWQTAVVGVSGAIASTVVLRINAYYHYELMFNDGEGAVAFATPPPASSPVVREASKGVLERIGGVIEGTAKKIDAVAKSAAFQYAAAFGASYYSKSPGPVLMIANQRGKIVD